MTDVVNEKQIEYSSNDKTKIEYFSDGLFVDAFVHVDSTEFTSVISNIINNAIESYSEGGLVKVFFQSVNDKCIVTVSDFGRGIPEEIVTQLGVKDISFGKEGGQGIGLSHAYRTITALRGHISIESAVGKGTTIKVILPKADPHFGEFEKENISFLKTEA